MNGATRAWLVAGLVVAAIGASLMVSHSTRAVYLWTRAGGRCVLSVETREQQLLGTSFGNSRHRLRCDEQVPLDDGTLLICLCDEPDDVERADGGALDAGVGR